MKETILRIRKWLTHHAVVRVFAILLLIVLCLFEAETIAIGLRQVDATNNLYVNYRHGQVVRQPQIVDPSQIQSWMTFQYVNFVFKLPPDYLENALDIKNKHYPNIQISRYATASDLPADIFLIKVRQAVTQYTPVSF